MSTKRLLIVTVNGTSMQPTLFENDRVLAWRGKLPWILVKNSLVVCDVSSIVYEHLSVKSVTPVMAIKRLVGHPNSQITLKTHLYPNLESASFAKKYKNDQYLIDIPPNHYFVVSDGNGVDSIKWGPLPIETLIAHVLFKISSNSSSKS